MKGTIIAAVFVAGVFAGGVMTRAQSPAPPNVPAERVTGIGGVFFKARDPKALTIWYREKLGIPPQGGGTFSIFEWREREDSRGSRTRCGRSSRPTRTISSRRS